MKKTLILEDSKFLWSTKEIKTCQELWLAGLTVYQIADEMDENPDDIALLVIHLGQSKKLKAEEK